MKRGLGGVGCALAVLAACSTFDASNDVAGSDAGVDGPAGPVDGGPLADGSAVDAPTSSPRYLYVFGGTNDVGSTTFVPASYRALVHDDGSLGVWERAPDLDVEREGAALAVTSTGVVFYGGAHVRDAGSSFSPSVVYWADAGWQQGTPVPSGLNHPAGAANGETVYVSGGEPDAGLIAASVRSATVTPSGVGSWSDQRAMPVGLLDHGMFVEGGRLYVAGGTSYTGSGFARSAGVVSAEIGADGTLGAWADAGCLGEAIAGAMIAKLGDRYLLAGGHNGGNSGSTTTWIGTVSAGGDIAWKEASPMPAPRAAACAASDGKTMYVLGGATSIPLAATADAYSAVITPGDIVSWKTLTAMPEARSYAGCVIR